MMSGQVHFGVSAAAVLLHIHFLVDRSANRSRRVGFNRFAGKIIIDRAAIVWGRQSLFA
jgi:hypothetical protein